MKYEIEHWRRYGVIYLVCALSLSFFAVSLSLLWRFHSIKNSSLTQRKEENSQRYEKKASEANKLKIERTNRDLFWMNVRHGALLFIQHM